MRIRLSVEEILLIYRDHFGQDTEIDVKTEKRFGSLRIALAIRCDSFNPIEDISEKEILLRRMMESLEYLPVWSYRNGIVFTVKTGSRLPSWSGVVIAALAGILAGIVAKSIATDALHRSDGENS